ncbi:MBL fold metallo-hydrolase [Geosporobacter ferrireducens]|uniref:MBL fold metallo-hydrolase n=1 Tax=Geosporobacter ferrireducens TaxID=1424294 RepID=A0A1D8GBW0_9FIRM|nr:MBL fold metallo-hydrolase [Geosporobacter ferrireducens]AOT68402.1 MBL fold metallo-hydrolase [Geosporobacter ferrireducens]MTI53853.1 MBL fold metallo-hydrolase [Geosporobacter ferrireducens]
MELKRITEKIYYIPNVVNIGCIVHEDNAILIDTGLEDHTGKKILNTLKKEGLKVTAVINTHSHADHCGGNAYIQSQTDAKTFASEIEEAIIRYPYLEPLYLFSGAHPLKSLQNKFLMAKPSKIDYVIKEREAVLEVCGLELGIVFLPGHSPGQMGIAFENVLFCADAFVSSEVLDKHKIPFNVDIVKHRKTLNYLKNSTYGYYIPAHSSPVSDITDVVEKNIARLDEIDSTIIEQLKSEKSTEQIFQSVCTYYGIQVNNLSQFYLLQAAVAAHLSGLETQDLIEANTVDNLVFWKRKSI